MTTTPPEPPENQPGNPYPAYPGEQPAAPQYGGYGAYPGQPAAPGQTPERPQPVSIAVRLMQLGALVSLVSLIVSFATVSGLKDEITDRLREDDPNVSQSTIDAAFAIGIGFAIVMGGIGIFLWLWMAWKNGQGRQWARIVATVLGGLNVLFLLLGLANPDLETATLVFSVVNLVLAAAILILLWRPESTRFYTAVTQSRQLR